MILKEKFVKINDKKIYLSKGSCKTYNTCYLARCKICCKPYTGRTVDLLHKRVNGHRHLFLKILKNAAANTLEDLDTTGDLYALGLHLYFEHGLDSPTAFNENFEFGILDVTTPLNIERKEYTWMHKLNTFQPVGINIEYPFGIPFLGQK